MITMPVLRISLSRFFALPRGKHITPSQTQLGEIEHVSIERFGWTQASGYGP